MCLQTMVVVAGEGIGDVVHDIPLCNVTKDRDSHRSVPGNFL